MIYTILEVGVLVGAAAVICYAAWLMFRDETVVHMKKQQDNKK
jgi:hypothetical protein